MKFTLCIQKQEYLIKLFAPLHSPEMKYEKIIELGRSLPTLAEEFRTEEHLVKGCQSQLYIRCLEIDGTIRYEAFSDALISAGLAALLLAVYNDEEPETIIRCPPDFLHTIGVFSSLSPNRSNGLRSLFLKMQQDAIKILSQYNTL